MKKRNYLLGIEMWVVGVSATNAIVFFATGSAISWNIAHFFDEFSRGFGMPIIAVAGLMAITHDYRPSVRMDVLLFAVASVITLAFVTTDFFDDFLPYYNLVMWTLFSVYLAYFIKRLLNVGAGFQAIVLLLGLVTSQAIACVYDFYKIPGDETNIVFNFYTLALCSWAYFMPAVYYAYCALERSCNQGLAVSRPVPFRN
ncbi:hypothetical protein [Paraburkholderia bannensis]|uniref:hypothetical protein n=1 Tax=Paraburkholderia bannensis TaxID=765414 RepID=UPI0038CD2F3C